jgi:hypothetical protein
MNKITLSKDNISFCYKNNCVNANGYLAKVLTYSLAFLVVIGSIASIIESSK